LAGEAQELRKAKSQEHTELLAVASHGWPEGGAPHEEAFSRAAAAVPEIKVFMGRSP